MKTALPEDIAEFAAVATKRLSRFGGPQAALQAEADDQLRQDAQTALSDLGAFDLDVRSSSEDLLAAVLCQAAGATVLPIRLSRSCWRSTALGWPWSMPKLPGSITAIWPVTGSPPTSTESGHQVQPSPTLRCQARTFSGAGYVEPARRTVPAADVDLHLTLGSSRIVGAVHQALDITRQHVVDRMQFGEPPTFRRSGSPSLTPRSRSADFTNSPSTPSPDGIGSGSSAFGGCSDPSTQGRRDRPASAAHRPPATGSAGLLRRV